jgi:hypothetical protein
MYLYALDKLSFIRFIQMVMAQPKKFYINHKKILCWPTKETLLCFLAFDDDDDDDDEYDDDDCCLVGHRYP